MDFHVEHEYDAAPNVVFAMLSDPEFLRARFDATEALDYEVAECAETPDGGFRIVTTRTVQADIPAFARKVFKPTTTMTQTENWEPASAGARGGTWRVEPKGVPVPVSTTGTTRLEAHGDGTAHNIAATIKVSVPLIGGKLERFVFDQAKKTLDREQEFGQRWLKEHA